LELVPFLGFACPHSPFFRVAQLLQKTLHRGDAQRLTGYFLKEQPPVGYGRRRSLSYILF
jgi:hypothetical protein